MKNLKYLLLFIVPVILAGCHKDPPKTYDDTDMTITYYDVEFDFNTYNTFIIPDSTVLTTNYLSDSEVNEFYKTGGASDKTLEEISEIFTGLGYTEVDSLKDSDFILVPTIMMMESDETVYYYPGWWWGYPSYGWGIGIGIGFKGTDYYYGWYPYYPWYPPQGYPVTVSTYNGTVAFEIIDTKSYIEMIEWNEWWYENNTDPPTDDDDPPEVAIRWQAMIEGYITDDGSYNLDRIERGIEEAIAQSPYLQK